MSRTNMTVVRNAAYRRSSLGVRERHNERKNESYYNSDIVTGRANLNVNFKQCEGSYEQTFDKLRAENIISTRGQRDDAKIVDELVFDVNTEYFDNRGGYDFAKKFYEEAYKCAIKEVGGEQYILSAVLHADERNREASERFGRDVWHYHLHVVYVPVVTKEVKWTKRAGAELEGKLKEVINQVSHSKKWGRVKTERGIVNSYSVLQDRFFDHMKSAGFDGFERGELGSTREHLSVTEYKVQQEIKRLEAVEKEIAQKQEKVKKLDDKIEVKKEKVAALDDKLSYKQPQDAMFSEIDAIGKPIPIIGGFSTTADEMKQLKSLARHSIKADGKIADLSRENTALKGEVSKAKSETNYWRREYDKLLSEVKDFIGAIRRFPARLREFIAELFRHEREAQQVHETQKQHKKSYDIGR